MIMDDISIDYNFLSLNQTASESMQKYLQSNIHKNARHIMHMQGLLQQYDRENKNLNKQVLVLLEENKGLKMDKIKANLVSKLLFHKSKDAKEAKNQSSKQNLKNSSVKLNKQNMFSRDISFVKQDQAIQVQVKTQKKAKQQQKERLKQSILIKDGQKDNPNRQSRRKQQNESIRPVDQIFTNNLTCFTLQNVQSEANQPVSKALSQIKSSQLKMQDQEITKLHEASRDLQQGQNTLGKKQQNSVLLMEQRSSFLSNVHKHQRSSSNTRKRANHSINPSPKLSSKDIDRNKSHKLQLPLNRQDSIDGKQRVFKSVQKKRFISLVSEKSNLKKRFYQAGNCC